MGVVVVTGGSRGIGRAAVELFSKNGETVYFLYEKDAESSKIVEKTTGATGFRCDVSNFIETERVFSTIGDVDTLVCAAGICHYGLLQDTDEQTFDRLFAVNVKGIYNCVRAALPGFLRRQAGSIVTVASMWGETGASCEAVYSATKGAVIALTKALAKELGPSGVRVNAVSPGVILTDMCANLAPETLAELAESTPLGRNGTAEDAARAIVALANAPFVTGQVLGVSGGYYI